MSSLRRASLAFFPHWHFGRGFGSVSSQTPTGNVKKAAKLDSSVDQEGNAAGKWTTSLPDRYVGQPSWRTHPTIMDRTDTTPGISSSEYAARRQEFMRKLASTDYTPYENAGAKNLVILQGAPVTFSAPDVPHPFRQDSNFLYLSGFQEASSILVLHDSRDDGKCESVLFVDPRDEHRELWEGPRAGVDGALALTGIDYVYEKEEFTSYIQSLAKRKFMFWRDTSKHLRLPTSAKSSPQEVDRSLSEYGLVNARNPIRAIHELRWIKSEAEIALLRRAGRIGALAMKETMRFSSPDVYENILAAKMDLECRIRGANCLAYPPVVAGGARANIIHYLNNDQQISGLENLVLMDAGCDLHGYVSDITRAWPVTGRFTDPQRILYEVVHDVQVALLKYVANTRPITLRDVFMHMMEVLAVGIHQAGILKNSAEDDIETAIQAADHFCPHHVSHYLGMDVHDVDSIPKNIELKPGVVITVEPGLYIKPNDQTVKEEFRGYGIRIEDDVLITNTGAVVLTDAVPKSPSEIEKVIRS